jgi:hypothetical protein
MAKPPADVAAPTMVIPRGTEVAVDAHGQLSIRAPGNLVIQNSGSYGTLESLGGSIRIDQNVEVEAVAVRCADTCFVQGSLTAWRVSAKALHVEETARAHIVLQETGRLEIGREARVVGNFGSEKELLLLFSRFARQVRSLPFYFDRHQAAPEASPFPEPPAEPADDAEVALLNEGGLPATPARASDLPEELFFALVLLERDADRGEYGPTSQRILEELIKLLRNGDVETLRHTHRTLFSRVLEPRPDVVRAQELVAGFFDS